MTKKRNKRRGSESNRIKNTRKRIVQKCMEMREKMKQDRAITYLNDEDIENRILIFRQMLFEKEDIPDEDLFPNHSEKKSDSAKKHRTSKKIKKMKTEKTPDETNSHQVSCSSDLNRKRAEGELSSKHTTSGVLNVNGTMPDHSLSSQMEKSSKMTKLMSLQLHPAVTSSGDGIVKDSLESKPRTVSGSSIEMLVEQRHRDSRSSSVERRKSRSYSSRDRMRGRSSERHSSYRRSDHSDDRSLSHSLSRSRSPSIRRRRGSPSHLDRRRITRK